MNKNPLLTVSFATLLTLTACDDSSTNAKQNESMKLEKQEDVKNIDKTQEAINVKNDVETAEKKAEVSKSDSAVPIETVRSIETSTIKSEEQAVIPANEGDKVTWETSENPPVTEMTTEQVQDKVSPDAKPETIASNESETIVETDEVPSSQNEEKKAEEVSPDTALETMTSNQSETTAEIPVSQNEEKKTDEITPPIAGTDESTAAQSDSETASVETTEEQSDEPSTQEENSSEG